MFSIGLESGGSEDGVVNECEEYDYFVRELIQNEGGFYGHGQGFSVR